MVNSGVLAMSTSDDILVDIHRALKTKSASLKNCTQHELIDFIYSEQIKLAKKHHVEGEIRKINAKSLHELIESVKEAKRAKFVFRHGEQEFTSSEKLTDAALKIKMMQLPNNMENPITKLSAIEFAATAFIFDYLVSNADLTATFESSVNRRAAQPAAMLADAMGSKISFAPKWSCMNYPNEPEFTQDGYIGYLENGALPWKKENVDKLGGQHTYDNFIHDAQEFNKISLSEGQALFVVTHTQQTNAISEQNALEVSRLNPYGFILLSAQNQIYANGIYSTEKFSLKRNKENTVLPAFKTYTQYSITTTSANKSVIEEDNPGKDSRYTKLIG